MFYRKLKAKNRTPLPAFSQAKQLNALLITCLEHIY